MKRAILPGLVTALIVAVSASGLLFGGQDRIPIGGKPKMALICHHANRNAPGVVISVPIGALKIHWSHGDRWAPRGAEIGDSCGPSRHPGPPKDPIGDYPKTP